MEVAVALDGGRLVVCGLIVAGSAVSVIQDLTTAVGVTGVVAAVESNLDNPGVVNPLLPGPLSAWSLGSARGGAGSS